MLKFSIITITHNEADCLRQALQSVADQHYSALEHIVVDGYSSDHTIQTVEEFPGVRLIRRRPAGIYDALNTGIDAATGEIIGIVHGNDRMPSGNVLKSVAAEFESDPGLDFIYGDLRYIRRKNGRPGRLYYAGDFKPSYLQGGMAPPHPTLYIRREVQQRLGHYRTDLPIAADYEQWIRLFNDKTLRYKYIPRVLAEMSTGGTSASLKSLFYTNNREKLRALRLNGMKANPLRLLMKYVIVIKHLLSAPRHE